MTNFDKASDQLLTEEAYARSIGKAGKVFPPRQMVSEEQYIRSVSSAHPAYPHVPMDYISFHKEVYLHQLEDWMKQHTRWSEWIDGYIAWRKVEAKKLHAGNNGTQLGPREFTLTYGEHFENPEEAQRVMASAIEKLTRYYRHEIIEFHAIGEYTKAGRPHVHGWYHLDGGKKITDKNFKRAYPPWNPKKKLGRGFEGGHHATIERVSDFHGYTEKHFQEAWLVKDITNDDGCTQVLRPPQAPHDHQGESVAPSGEAARQEGDGEDCEVSDEATD